MLIDSKYISDNDMKQINKNTRKVFTRDDIYAFEITLCDNELDADCEVIDTESLYKLKDLALGSFGFLTSDIKARIFDTYIEKTFISRSNSKLVEEIYKLKAKVYVLKKSITEEELNKLLNHPKISVGFSVNKRVCSICGSSECCEHIKGQKYIDEAGIEQVCYRILKRPTDFYEWSIVPNQQESKTNNNEPRENKITTVKTKLMIDGKLTDVKLDENGGITIIKPEKKATGWDFSTRPYYITAAGVTGGKGLNCDGMDKIYQTANAFSSEELAESINRMQTLQRQIFRWQAENDVPIRGGMDKYIICAYESIINCEKVYGTEYPFLPCFSSKEKAEKCRELFIEDLQWLFTKFRWRMDGDSNKQRN